MQIRKATIADIAALGQFYDDEIQWMDAHDCNYLLWTYKGYPTTATVEWTIGEGTQFMYTEGEEGLGTMAAIVIWKKVSKKYRCFLFLSYIFYSEQRGLSSKIFSQSTKLYQKF